MHGFRLLVPVLAILFGMASAVAPLEAAAQKRGGTLVMIVQPEPPSLASYQNTSAPIGQVSAKIYDGLLEYDFKFSPQPSLAKSWTVSPDGRTITFKLQEGVKFHDGKPLTSADVQFTFMNVLKKVHPRGPITFRDLEAVDTPDPLTAVFKFAKPAPYAMVALSGYESPILPKHLFETGDLMNHPLANKPVGTGPFKFVELKQNESIKLVKNPEYWKKGRPYLDAIEYRIIPSRATSLLAFVANQYDLTFTAEIAPPALKDLKGQAPWAQCELLPTNTQANLLVNRDRPPFDNAQVRKAMVLAIDRSAFTEIIGQGANRQGGALLPPPEGLWGMPPEFLATVAGYGADIEKQREEGRKIMKALGYGPDKTLKIKVSTRNIPSYRDQAVILIDHLKQVYIQGELEPLDTSVWYNRLLKKDYSVGMNIQGVGIDDPDVVFYETYSCGSERNYTNYCDPETEKLFDKQSRTADIEARKKLVWEIDKKLQEDGARPVIQHGQGATCWRPELKGIKLSVNSIYNHWRFEDVWLDR
jgi:peptide/nickel transport system substrate-binding protein